MGRKDDVETHIRESYNLIREYELLAQTASDPKERLRIKRVIGEQQSQVRTYLEEYDRLCFAMKIYYVGDIAEISFSMGASPQRGLNQNNPNHLQSLSEKVRQALETYFNLTELRNLCFELNVDEENLATYGKSDLARELVRWSERHDRFSELAHKIKSLRPHARLD